ncbi:MAG: MarR family transcriptional regulator, partial [Rhodobacteraceae bacterium]|nr:MarR family transcriptional regulator [Paracoccaceae bacterium]
MLAKAMTADLPVRAEDMFCFAAYAASHAINRAYGPLLKPLGLTYPQYILLTFLWAEDGQTIGGLARHFRMESSTLTPLVKRLEVLGHVERRRSIADERQVFVFLTGRGRALSEQAPEITRCIIAATGMEASRLDDLVRTLGQLVT